MALKANSMSTALARITRRVEAAGGTVSEERLDMILRQSGVTRQGKDYRDKLVLYSYLDFDKYTRKYTVSKASRKTAKIEIRVKPSLYADEVRRGLVEYLAVFNEVIEVGEVEQ